MWVDCFALRLQGLEDDEAIAFTSHGWLAEFVGALYQAIYPGHFQLLKFADTYRFMHFALLDFVINPETSALELIFRVINFRGEEVMTRSFPLPKKSSIYADRPSYSVTCDPVRGPVPLWRHLLLRAVVAALILLVLVLPALGILYLACMSIFYIFVGKELRRRETLEHRYQSLSQPSLHAHAD